MNRKTIGRFALTGMLAAALALGGGPAASASAPENDGPQGGQIPCGTTYTVTNPMKLTDTTTWPNSDNWRVDGQGPGTLSISRALTSTNSVSGSAGVPLYKITPVVGFDVSKSSTVTTSFSITLKSGERRQIQVGQVWARTSFDWKKMSGCAGNMTTTTGTGIAKKFMRYSYRSVKI